MTEQLDIWTLCTQDILLKLLVQPFVLFCCVEVTWRHPILKIFATWTNRFSLLLLRSPLWALVVSQDAQSCGGCCQGGPVSHRGGQVISCSERPLSLTAVSVVRNPTPTSVALLSYAFLKLWWIALKEELPHAAAELKMDYQGSTTIKNFCPSLFFWVRFN